MKKFLAIFCVIALFSSVALADDEWKYEKDVLVLTDKNFQKALETFPNLLVKFYANFCGHCKALAPIYEKAAGKLRAADPQVTLAHIECTEEKEACQKYSVQGYPTVKFFSNGGSPADYQGARTEEAIVSWCLKKTGPASVELSSKDAVEKLQTDNKVAVVYFGEKGSNFDNFEKFAKTFDGVVFGHSFDENLRKEFNVDGSNVVLFKQFDERRNDCNCEVTAENLKTFVEGNYLPTILDFDQTSAQKIFGDQKPCLFLLIGKDSKSQQASQVLDEASSKLKGKVLMSRTEVADGLGKRLGDFIGVKDSEVPTVRIVVPGPSMKKFTMTEEITVENLVKFFDDFTAGKLTNILKSEPIPETNDKAVKVVVGKSFNDVVMDETKDVLVKFYAPWCGHCKKMAPDYEKAAELIREKNPNIVIADFDATQNEAEGVEIQGFPTIKFYPANNKKSPVDFSESRDLQGILKFLKEKNSVGWVEPDAGAATTSDSNKNEASKEDL